jgi:hypothetical protein
MVPVPLGKLGMHAWVEQKSGGVVEVSLPVLLVSVGTLSVEPFVSVDAPCVSTVAVVTVLVRVTVAVLTCVAVCVCAAVLTAVVVVVAVCDVPATPTPPPMSNPPNAARTAIQ